jgi:lantibiotic modifying enzyme
LVLSYSFLSFLQPIEIPTSFLTVNNTNNDDLDLNLDNLKSDFLEKSIEISNILIRVAETDTGSYIKWKKYLNILGNSTEYSQYYTGLYYGVAGIGSYFLKMYDLTHNISYLGIAEKAAQYIIKQSIYENSLTSWARSEDSGSSYTSLKYGNAGISLFLLDLYKETSNKTILEFSERSLNTLIKLIESKKDEGKAYSYSLYGGDAITDLMYGATGISSAFLKAYQITQNQTYFTEAIDAVNWVISLSNATNDITYGLRSILYSPSSFYQYSFTGYSSGAAGIGDYLLELYNLTRNDEWLKYAKQIGNWLYSRDINGLWPYGGVDYLTDNANEEGSYLGFSAGSAGIGMFFLNLYDYSKDSCYLKPVLRIKEALDSEIKSVGDQRFWSNQATGVDEEKVTTDLKSGVAGIGLFYSKLYSFFGNNDDLLILSGINEFFKSNTNEHGLIPSDIGIDDQNKLYDSSYFEGLAGIGIFYLEGTKAINSKAKHSISEFDNSCKIENSSKSTNFGSFLFVLIIISVLAIIKRRKSLN